MPTEELEELHSTYSTQTSGGILTSWLLSSIRSRVLSISCSDVTSWLLSDRGESVWHDREADNSHFGVENRLPLGLEVGDNDSQLAGVLNELFQLRFQIAETGHGRTGRRRQSHGAVAPSVRRSSGQQMSDAPARLSAHRVRRPDRM